MVKSFHIFLVSVLRSILYFFKAPLSHKGIFQERHVEQRNMQEFGVRQTAFGPRHCHCQVSLGMLVNPSGLQSCNLQNWDPNTYFSGSCED